MAMHFIHGALVQKHRFLYRDTRIHDALGVVPTLHVVCRGREWFPREAQFKGKSQRLDNKVNRAQRQGLPVTFDVDTCQTALDVYMCWIFDDWDDIKNYDIRTCGKQKCYTCPDDEDDDRHAAAAFGHREVFNFAYKMRCRPLCELAEQKFIYAITCLVPDKLEKIRDELENQEKQGERRLRNALRRFLEMDPLPNIPFPADDRPDDDDDDNDEGFGGDDNLPGPGNGGPGAGPDDDGSDDDDEDDDEPDNNRGRGAGARGRHASHETQRDNNDGEEDRFLYNPARDDSPALSIVDSIEDEFSRSPPRQSSAASHMGARQYPAALNAGGTLDGLSSRSGVSTFGRRQGPFVVDDEDELDHLGPDLPGSLANGSRRGLPSIETPRGRAAGGRQATESTEIKQETPRPSKRKEPGGSEYVLDLTGDDVVEVKIEPGFPRTKRPCRPQDITAVLDLTGDDEEIQDVTAQHISEAQHRLRCPRCETYFQSKLPRMGNYRHACPPGPVVAEHSNEQSYEAWTQRYQDRRSQPI